jgi:hypothetical protein
MDTVGTAAAGGSNQPIQPSLRKWLAYAVGLRKRFSGREIIVNLVKDLRRYLSGPDAGC